MGKKGQVQDIEFLQQFHLNIGENEIRVVVTSKVDPTITITYNFHVKRLWGLEQLRPLSEHGLPMAHLEFEKMFDPSKQDYTVEVLLLWNLESRS